MKKVRTEAQTYIPKDVVGFDYGDVVPNFIKAKLDLGNSPLVPAAKVLDNRDSKGPVYAKTESVETNKPRILKDEFEENVKKFLENLKIYIGAPPPQVPVNIWISKAVSAKSGKSVIANMLNEKNGGGVIGIEKNFGNVEKYIKKTWTEPVILRVQFKANEFKGVNIPKKTCEKKSDNLEPKILFAFDDSMDIPHDIIKTKVKLGTFGKYHRGQIEYIFKKREESKERGAFAKKNETKTQKEKEKRRTMFRKRNKRRRRNRRTFSRWQSKKR